MPKSNFAFFVLRLAAAVARTAVRKLRVVSESLLACFKCHRCSASAASRECCCSERVVKFIPSLLLPFHYTHSPSPVCFLRPLHPSLLLFPPIFTPSILGLHGLPIARYDLKQDLSLSLSRVVNGVRQSARRYARDTGPRFAVTHPSLSNKGRPTGTTGC